MSRPTSSVFGGTLNLLNTCVGGGTALVALPLAMSKLGIVLGVAMFALFGVLVAFSLWLLIAAAESLRSDELGASSVNRMSERTSLLVAAGAVRAAGASSGALGDDASSARGTITYNELGRRAYGHAGLTAFNVTVLVNNIGMAVLFLDLLGDILPSLLTALFHLPSSTWWLSRTALLVAISVALFPLLLFKHIEALKYASLVGIAAAAVLVGVVLYAGVKNSSGKGLDGMFALVPEPSHPARSIRDVFVGVPIIVFVYTCHYNMFSIYNGFPGSERARSMWRVVVWTFALDFALYVFVGLAGYFAFRAATQANVITQLANAHVAPYALMVAVQLGFAIGIVFTIPLFNLEARVGFQYVWRQLRSCCCSSSAPGARKGQNALLDDDGASESSELARPGLNAVFVVETAVLSLVFLGISLVVKDIGVVFGVIGATTATAISYVYPALFFLRVVPRARRSARVTNAAIALVAFGLVAGSVSLAAAIAGIVG